MVQYEGRESGKRLQHKWAPKAAREIVLAIEHVNIIMSSMKYLVSLEKVL